MFVPREVVDADGFLRFSCRNLTDEHLCGIYATRPDICRRYPEPEMMDLGGGLLSGCGFTMPQKTFDEILDDKIHQFEANKRAKRH